MATSEVSICNIAIARVGGESISTLSENTKAAKLCNVFYEPMRDAVLADAWWTFATKRQTLARLSTAPLSEFDYAYQLPSDLAGFQYVYQTTPSEYRIEGQTLATDSTEVKLVYTAVITDPAQFTKQFIDCLSFRLAAELAMPLTNRPTNQANFFSLYEAALKRAKVTDRTRDNRKYPVSSRWVDVRKGGDGYGERTKKLSNE